MIKGIISTGSYIIKLLINIYEKFYKSTAVVREEVYIGVFHRKILIFQVFLCIILLYRKITGLR